MKKSTKGYVVSVIVATVLSNIVWFGAVWAFLYASISFNWFLTNNEMLGFEMVFGLISFVFYHWLLLRGMKKRGIVVISDKEEE